MKSKLLQTLVAISLLFSLIPAQAHAQTASGLQMSPLLQEIDMKPGETKSLSFELKNITTTAQTVKTSYANFSPNSDGTPKILADTEKTDFGLRTWFEFDPNPTFAVLSSSTRTVTIKLTAPTTAKNQTYYGTVLFAVDDGTNKSTALGSLIFVNIGTPVYKGSVTGITVQKSDVYNGSADVELSMDIKNDGQYKFTPTAAVEITTPDGKVFKKLDPEKTGSVLPQSSRTYTYKYNGAVDAATNYEVRPAATLADGTKLAGGASVPFVTSDPPDTPAIITTNRAEAKSPVKTKDNLTTTYAAFAGISVLVLAIILLVIRYLKRRVPSKLVTSQHDVPAPLPQTIAPLQPTVPTTPVTPFVQPTDPPPVAPAPPPPPQNKPPIQL